MMKKIASGFDTEKHNKKAVLAISILSVFLILFLIQFIAFFISIYKIANIDEEKIVSVEFTIINHNDISIRKHVLNNRAMIKRFFSTLKDYQFGRPNHAKRIWICNIKIKSHNSERKMLAINTNQGVFIRYRIGGIYTFTAIKSDGLRALIEGVSN